MAKRAQQGLKARDSFCNTFGPAEAVPLLHSLFRLSFSAACKASADFRAFGGTTEQLAEKVDS